jgi:hypothetical protein
MRARHDRRKKPPALKSLDFLGLFCSAAFDRFPDCCGQGECEKWQH